jgi:molybdopterin molybdotransferase
MISVPEALQIVLDNTPIPQSESVLFDYCLNRILAETIKADRDFPPFDRVSMDGIAINAEKIDLLDNIKSEGIQAAGSPQLSIENPQNCIEVMTGAIMPQGLDTVIRYEDLTKNADDWSINIPIIKGKNVHRQGFDKHNGDVLIEKGICIKSHHKAILASVGKVDVKVYKRPRIALISTGDELVDIDKTPKLHQIRKSNIYMLSSLLEERGIKSSTYHLNDDYAEIKSKMEMILKNHDAILLSGGVSMGKYDFLPKVFEDLKIKKGFHKVEQRPGKPFWFGSINDKAIFAFPGNPISTLVCYLQYFNTWLSKYENSVTTNHQKAVLNEDIIFRPQLTYFAQVKIMQKDGRIMAQPKLGKGSGDFTNLVDIDGFLVLPAREGDYKKGELFEFLAL